MILTAEKTETTQTTPRHRPTVWLAGRADHPDFRDATALLRADAAVMTVDDDRREIVNLDQAVASPELVIIAQDRPGSVRRRHVESLAHQAPLAGFVALVGSWCEGELRSARPYTSIPCVRWYEFPGWWRRQMSLRDEGRCPDWARSADFGFRISDCGSQTTIRHPQGVHPPWRAIRNGGLIVLAATRWETADVLAGILQEAGYASMWQRPGHDWQPVRGAVAGIWEGGQLDDREADELAAFSRRLAHDAAPVVALLDFPRRDRCKLAIAAGAAVVIGKPWLNTELIETVRWLNAQRETMAAKAQMRAA